MTNTYIIIVKVYVVCLYLRPKITVSKLLFLDVKEGIRRNFMIKKWQKVNISTRKIPLCTA